MSDGSAIDLFVSQAEFAATHAAMLVAKINKHAYTSTDVARRATRQWPDWVDDNILALQSAVSGASTQPIGAVGDGVADDTEAIQDAIDEAFARGGGEVRLPAGTFLITERLTLPSGVTLRGAGVPGTTIRGAIADALIGVPDPTFGASPIYRAGGVEDLLLDNTSRATAGGVGIDLAMCYDRVVSNVTVQNVETGIAVRRSAYWNHLENVRIAVVDIGVDLSENANENTADACHVVDCEVGYRIRSVGASGGGCSNNLFDHCAAEQFNAGSQYGYHIDSTSQANAVDGTVIVAPRLERAGAGGTGVRMDGTHRGTSILDPLLVNVTTVHAGRLEDTLFRWRGQAKSGLRVGLLDDFSSTSHALLNYSTANSGRVFVRSSANSAYLGLRAREYAYGTSGAFDTENAGTPEGAVTAGVVSTCRDTTNGRMYVKRSGTGNTGWVEIGEVTQTQVAGVGGVVTLARAMGALDVVNTTTPTALISHSVPGGTIAANNMLRGSIVGTYLNNSLSTRNFTVRVNVGGTTLTVDTFTNFTSAASPRRAMRIDFEIGFPTTSSQRAYVNCKAASTNAATDGYGDLATAQTIEAFNVSDTDGAVDMSSARVVELTIEHSAADPTISFQRHWATLEMV